MTSQHTWEGHAESHLPTGFDPLDGYPTDADHTTLAGRVTTLEAASVATVVRKTANQTNTGTTITDDTELLFAIAANEVWTYEIWLIVNSPTGSDFQHDFTVPASATIYRNYVGGDVTGVVVERRNTTAGTDEEIETTGAAILLSPIRGIVVNGANAGTVTLRWSQDVDAGEAAVLANSFLIKRKLA